MADLERRLKLAASKLDGAIQRFGRGALEISDRKIVFSTENLLRAAVFFALHRHLDLLAAVGSPFHLATKPRPLFILHSDHIEIATPLQNRTLFLTLLHGALALAINLLLDEKAENQHRHLEIREFPPLQDPQLGISQFEAPSTIQMMEGIFSEKELQELARNAYVKLADDLEKELRSRFRSEKLETLLEQVEDLGPEAKGKALLTIGRTLL